jgi:hypothetical protein
MEDMDLMARQRDLPALGDILRSLGYAPRPESPGGFRRGALLADTASDALNSARAPGRLAAFPVTAEALLTKAPPLGGNRALVCPCPEDALVCLALHSLKHGLAQDRHSADTLWLLWRHPGLTESGLLRERAKAFNAELPLALVLGRAACWPGMEELAARLPRAAPGPFAGFCARRLLTDAPAGNPLAAVYGELCMAALCPGTLSRARWLWDLLVPPGKTHGRALRAAVLAVRAVRALFRGKCRM